MNGELNVNKHLKEINKRIGFITMKLYPIRNIDDLKLNINLFKVFIMPLYRLSLA
jgi:hypothetical protein